MYGGSNRALRSCYPDVFDPALFQLLINGDRRVMVLVFIRSQSLFYRKPINAFSRVTDQFFEDNSQSFDMRVSLISALPDNRVNPVLIQSVIPDL